MFWTVPRQGFEVYSWSFCDYKLCIRAQIWLQLVRWYREDLRFWACQFFEKITHFYCLKCLVFRFYYFLHFKSPQNIVLMNSPYVEPHHGAMTDVNIWKRILTEQEQSDWMFCKTETGGMWSAGSQLSSTSLDWTLTSSTERRPVPAETYLALSISDDSGNG